MRINGFQKMTLLDFPGNVACTVFTGGCNLRCPFCHNALLVTELSQAPTYETEEILSFLKKRTGLLDGVCITGGEPLIQTDIAEFIAAIKEMGFAVKLDTNGFYPEKLRRLIESGSVDYVAMDIKNRLEKYAETVGVPGIDTAPVEESIKILLEGKIDFEFRTTVVSEFHTVGDIEEAARMILGAPNYFLQNFVDSGGLIGSDLHAVPKEEIERMREAASKYVKNTQIRGL